MADTSNQVCIYIAHHLRTSRYLLQLICLLHLRNRSQRVILLCSNGGELFSNGMKFILSRSNLFPVSRKKLASRRGHFRDGFTSGLKFLAAHSQVLDGIVTLGAHDDELIFNL